MSFAPGNNANASLPTHVNFNLLDGQSDEGTDSDDEVDSDGQFVKGLDQFNKEKQDLAKDRVQFDKARAQFLKEQQKLTETRAKLGKERDELNGYRAKLDNQYARFNGDCDRFTKTRTQSFKEHQKLAKDHAELTKDHAELAKDHDKLVKERDELVKDHTYGVSRASGPSGTTVVVNPKKDSSEKVVVNGRDSERPPNHYFKIKRTNERYGELTFTIKRDRIPLIDGNLDPIANRMINISMCVANDGDAVHPVEMSEISAAKWGYFKGNKSVFE
jgi:hypothetical protein